MRINKLILGLIILALGLWGAVSWWWFLVDIIKGLVVVGLLGTGLILVGLGLISSPVSTSEIAVDKTYEEKMFP